MIAWLKKHHILHTWTKWVEDRRVNWVRDDYYKTKFVRVHYVRTCEVCNDKDYRSDDLY